MIEFFFLLGASFLAGLILGLAIAFSKHAIEYNRGWRDGYEARKEDEKRRYLGPESYNRIKDYKE